MMQYKICQKNTANLQYIKMNALKARAKGLFHAIVTFRNLQGWYFKDHTGWEMPAIHVWKSTMYVTDRSLGGAGKVEWLKYYKKVTMDFRQLTAIVLGTLLYLFVSFISLTKW